MSSPANRKRKVTAKEEIPQTPIPDDLLLSCIARVSRLFYPTLSLVSKRFRSLLASPELYMARSLIESCLYVCLRLFGDTNPIWFTLTKKKSGGFALATLRFPNLGSPPPSYSSLVAVGSNIYNIVRYGLFEPLAHVWIMDCKSHTWREAPSLPVKVASLSAYCLVDQKIHVLSYGSFGSKSEFRVLDTKTQSLDHPEPIPFSDAEAEAADGKLHVAFSGEVVAYNSKECRWEEAREATKVPIVSSCNVENVLYCVSESGFVWYDSSELGRWRDLKGLVGLPLNLHRNTSVRLAGYGGKMAVFWDGFVPCGNEKVLFCAVIALVRLKRGEICGMVEWCDAVLTLPGPFVIMGAVAATV